jgi:outer membrane immunogenic protein
MRKLAIAAVALAVTSTAYAADMPLLKAPPMAPAAYDWSGLTFDADIGWGGSNLNWNYNHSGLGGAPINAPLSPFSLSTSSAAYGGHVGFQKQWGWIVVGVEAGILENMAGNFAKVTSVAGGPSCTIFAGQVCQAHIGDSIYTVGGKLGVAWGDWLFYGEGGGAWSEVQTQLVAVGGALFDSNAQNRHGYYAGGGFDYVLAKGPLMDLIAGLEYQHVGLGTGFMPSPADAFSSTGANARTVSAHEDLVLAKLTVKWNPWTQPHP